MSTVKKKKVPPWIRSSVLRAFLQSRPAAFISYWLFQGILMMNGYERLIKIVFDAGVFSVMYASMRTRTISPIYAFVISFFIAHSLNMLLNGHVFALGKFMGIAPISRTRYNAYVRAMINRWQKAKHVSYVIAYGSLSREERMDDSDFDVAVITSGSMRDSLVCALLVARERCIACWHRFPIDIYLVSGEQHPRHMRNDELPLVLVAQKTPELLYANYKMIDAEKDFA